MNTKILTEFQTVYEMRSIHGAAKKLFITPQGLGKNIRQLEQELNTKLFERTKQGMIPTAGAKLLYSRCEQIIRQLRQIDDELRQLEGQDRRLKIGCAYGVFNIMPLQKILDFIRENQDIQVEYYEYSNARIQSKLLESRLDYGLMVGRTEDSGLFQERLAVCPVVLLVYEGHDFYDQDSISIRQLKGEKLLSMNEDFWICHEMIRRCRENGFEPEFAAKSVDGMVLQKLCSQGIGLAIVPEVVTGEMNMSHLRYIPFKEAIYWEIFGTCRKDTAQYSGIRRIREALADIKQM